MGKCYPAARDPRPRDHTDAAKYLARDLANIAGQLATLKGETNNYLRDPSYATLRLRLEKALAAVEAATVKERAALEQTEELRRVRSPICCANRGVARRDPLRAEKRCCSIR